MLAAIIFGTVLAQERTVTFTHACAHSSVVLEAFGKEIGETIRPSGSVNKDYFLVRFDGMPVEDAKAAIAKTLNATWTRQGDVIYLTRTGSQERAEESLVKQQFYDSLKRTIAAAQKRTRERKSFNMAYLVENMQKETGKNTYESFIDSESPFGRFGDRIMATLNADDVMAMPYGKTYYANEPKLDEMPFPQSWLDALQIYRDEAEMWSQVMDRLYDKDDDRWTWSIGSEGIVTWVAIDIDRSRLWATFNLSVRAGNTELGLTIGSASGGYNGRSEWGRFTRDLNKPFEVPEELRSVWKERDLFAGFLPRMRRPGARTRGEVSGAIKKIVTDTGRNEPLTTLVSWPILEAAERKETNIVALLDDYTLAWPFESNLAEGQTLSRLFSYYGPPLMAEYDDELSCWLARPFDPSRVRKNRMNRGAFGDLIRKADAQKWISLDDMAGFIQRTNLSFIIGGWQSLIDETQFPDERSSMGYRGNPFTIATEIYASLPNTQRRAAWSGGVELAITGWTHAIRQALSVADWDSIRFLPPGAEPPTHEPPQGRMAGAVFRERLPAQTVLRVEVVATTEFWVSKDGKTGYQSQLGDYANSAVREESRYRSTPETDTFAAGLSETLSVQLFVPGVGTLDLTAQFSRTPFLDEFVTMEKLPLEFQRSIKNALAAARGGGSGSL